MKLMKVPSIQQSPKWPVSDFTTAFDRTKTQYGAIVNKVASVLKIPKELIYGIIATESQGFMNATKRLQDMSKSSNWETDDYVGLMQIGKAPITDALLYLTKNGMYSYGNFKAPENVRNAVIPLIQKYIPEFNYNLSEAKTKALADKAFKAAKQYAEFNILIASLELWILMTMPRFSDDGVVRLDKVVAALNWGQNRSVFLEKAKPTVSDTVKLHKTIPVAETKNHIIKLMGVNGAYDLLFNKKYIV